jgi:hypothetical protein
MANIKGTALLPAVKLVRKHRDKLDTEAMNEEGKTLLAQRISPASWYPLGAASQIMIAVNKVVGGGSLAQGMEVMGAHLAEMDLRGVYRNVIQIGDVAKSLRRSAILWPSYFDEGTLTITQPDPKVGRAVARLERFTQTIPYCKAIPGMARVVARLAGEGAICEVKEMKCTLRGDDLCEFHYVWVIT